MTNSEKLHRKIRIKENIPLYTMIALPLLFFIIFAYVPMFGAVIAFKDYRFIDGIMGSDWVGLAEFQDDICPATHDRNYQEYVSD
jgi:putative aldouronate transport system permease protein